MRKRKKNRLRWLEYLFLLAGLIAVDYYVWVNVQSNLSQIYSEWKFDREVRGEDASIKRFIFDESGLRRMFGLGRAPSRAPSPQQPQPPAPPQEARKFHHYRTDELVGRLEIPRLKLRVMVREGDDASTLRHAAGHIPSTAFPGDRGNVAFAAHRDTFFRPLRNIQKDDKILVSTLDGNFEYVVDSTSIVSPTDVSVLKASARPELTLVTCYPFYYIGSAPHRFVVHATQVSSSPVNSLSGEIRRPSRAKGG